MEKNGHDILLWLQFKNGDKDAFTALYKLNVIPLISYGVKLCADRELLKDAIQELFLELWQSRANLAATDSVIFYLIKALRYKLIRMEKQQHIQKRVGGNGFSQEYFESPVEDIIVEKESQDSAIALLKKAVGELTRRQQEIIQLRFYQGFSNEQIAELMNMHYQSVSNLLYNALCRLKGVVKNADLIVSIPLLFFFLI